MLSSGMDLPALAVVSMFGAALVGGLIGWLVGHVTRFELGLTIGLTIFGGVTMWFASSCYQEYSAFAHAGPNGLWGEVIKIENVPVGGGTQEEPIVRFTAPDNTVYTVTGPRASGFRAGEAVNIIFNPADPERSKVGQVTQYRGCAIAMLLFGTFPLSFAVFMLYSLIVDRERPRMRGIVSAAAYSHHNNKRAKRDDKQQVKVTETRPARAARFGQRSVIVVNTAFFVAVIGVLSWMGYSACEIEMCFVQGFGAIALSIFLYAVAMLVIARISSSTVVGMSMLALNFGVWAWAMSLLT